MSIKSSIYLAAFAAAISALPAAPAFAQGSMVPAGSYLDSCTNVAYNASTHLLTASCQGKMTSGDFAMGTNSLDVSNCADNGIWNDQGMLYCTAARPWGEGFVVPAGSYIQTCSNREVVNNVLLAECGMASGGSYKSRLDLTKCRFDADISNDNGSLRCEPGNTPPAPPRAPLLTMAPVKPATPLIKLAPIAPATPGASETPAAPPSVPPPPAAETAKKKRILRRGERG